jgi:Tol biopolymer transport system component
VGGAGAGELWVYDLQRDVMAQLTFHARVGRCPVWAPDGKHIALAALGASGGYDIWWIRSDGAGEPHVILDSKGASMLPNSFTPDGKHLSYTNQSGLGGGDIWVLPLDLSDPDRPKPGQSEALLRTSASETEGAFSPDGRWLAYTSDDSGASQVYVAPYRAGELSGGGRWRISTGGGRSPIWSHDGRQIFYRSADDRIMAADCTAQGDSFESGKPRRWSERQLTDPIQGPFPMLDVAPDGKRFVVAESATPIPGQQGSAHVTFLLNFYDELRRMAPVR